MYIISDQQFIQQFEHQTLAVEHFDHIGHIRIAWLYLQHFTQERAIDKVCVGIRNYAASLGAKNKFHYTITDALVRIIANRINNYDQQSWQEFVNANQDIVINAYAVLRLYYSDDLLRSTQARVSLLAPDLRQIQ